MIYTDTDSFVLRIKSLDEEYYWQQLAQMQDESPIFDFSNLPRNHQVFDYISRTKEDGSVEDGKKILGYFKDEMAGQYLIEFIALRPKMYSMLKLEGKQKRTHKGFPGTSEICAEDGKKLERQEKIDHQHYINALKGNTYHVTYQTIRNDKVFHLWTQKETKKGFGACDDKSYWFNHKKSLRYGHFRIPEVQERFKEQ
jgi:hypothetical protein